MKRLAAFLGLCRALPALILAQTNDSTLRPVAFQSGIEQAALGQQADQLARDVATLMDELQRNGFPAESLTGLTSLVGQLEAVGGADMKPLADRLRRVAESSGGDLRAAVADAYRDQQSIELRLASLSRQLVVQQLRADAIRQLELLIGRQLAAQRETRTLGSTANRPADRVNLLESDQAAIGTELAGFFQTGETLLSRLQDNDPAAALNGTSPVNSPNFAERVNAPYLTTLSDEALAAVKAGKFPEAFARQAALLAEFRRILDGVLASQPVTQRLASALQQLEALKQEQAALAADPAPNAAAQQALADEAQLLAQQVAPVSPAAAEAMTKAQAAMLPSPPPPAGTPPPPAEAAAQPAAAEQALAQAQDALQQQLAQAQATDAAQAQATAANEPAQTGDSPGAAENKGQGEGPGKTPSAGTMAGPSDGKPSPPGQQAGGRGGSGENLGLMAAAPGPDGGPAQTVGALKPGEQAALQSLQNERYPAEYSAWVQQYWRNLAAQP